jgi:sugar phosphate isomerase/epimerase
VRSAAGIERVGLFSSCLPGWDLQRVIELARSLELRGLEWGAGPGEAVDPGIDGEALRERCHGAGLAVSGLSVQDPSVSAVTPRRALPYVRLADSLAAAYIRLFAPPYQGGSVVRELQRARGGIDAVVESAGALGIAVLIETAPATLAPTPELAVSLVEHHAPAHAGVLYDPGNTVIEGYVAPALAAARLGAHLRHVHVKNIAWGRRSGIWAWRYAALSAGLLDWREVLSGLAGAGYTGGFSLDHLSRRPTPSAIRAETEHLARLIDEPSASDRPRGHPTSKGAVPSPASV